MPRVKDRSSEEMQQRLLRAAGSAATGVIQDASGTDPIVPVEVKAVLASVNHDLEQEGIPKLTTGFVNSAFGGKQEFLRRAFDAVIAPNTVGAEAVTRQARERLAAGKSPQAVRAYVVHADLGGLLVAQGESRVYFAHHAYSSRPAVRESLATVYREFDELYVPLYEDELRARGRRLVGVTVQDFAKLMTALVEGFALRCLGDQGEDVAAIVGSETELGLAARASEVLMEGLSVPVRSRRR